MRWIKRRSVVFSQSILVISALGDVVLTYPHATTRQRLNEAVAQPAVSTTIKPIASPTKRPATGRLDAERSGCAKRSVPFDVVSALGIELTVILQSNTPQQIQLRFKEVDVAFLVLQQLFEQRHGHIVLFVAADLA